MSFRISAEIDNMSDMQKERATSPVQVFDYVRAVDIGIDYVSGSEGLLKTLVEYEERINNMQLIDLYYLNVRV